MKKKIQKCKKKNIIKMLSLKDSDSGFNSEDEIEGETLIECLQHRFLTKENLKPKVEIKKVKKVNNDWIFYQILLKNGQKMVKNDPKNAKNDQILDILREINDDILFLNLNNSEKIEFEMLGWMSKVKDGEKTRGIVLSYQQKKCEICKKNIKLMMSLHSDHFYQFVHKYFEEDFIFDHSNKTWYYCDNGKWKNHNNGMENFILSKKIKSEISYLYENTAKQRNKEFFKYEQKLCKGGLPYRIERGSIKKTEYIPCRLFLKTGEKDTEIKNHADIKDFQSALKADEQYQICQQYVNKCLDADKFIPNAIKALRENFSQSNVDEKFDNDPYILAFDNCYIDLNHVITTKQIIPLPHNHRKFTAMSTKGNLLNRHVVNEEIEILNKNVGRCFTEEEKYKTMLKSKAYCLFGENPMKKIFINYGKDGNNGKGLTDSLMEISLGDYYSCIHSDFIIDGKNSFDAERPQPSLCASMKCRYLSMSEMEEGAKLSGKTVKSIRGGNALSVRTLHSERKKLIPQFTPHLDTNHCPEFGNGGKALQDSVFIISWEVSFEAESEEFKEETKFLKFSNDIKSIIYEDKYYCFGSAWIWILLESLESKFENHKDFEELKKEETESTNYIKQYFEDEIVDTISDDSENEFEFLQIKNLYEHASRYFRRQNISIPVRKKFKDEFEKLIPKDRIIEKKTPINIKIKGTDNKKSVRSYYKSYKFNITPE
jgi:phage/plasmid-associated DNA primase